jgi:HEAT repeat protein
LQSSETPKAEKAIACKKLAIHGSSAAVAELERLLPDPQLSSWARIALEAIPGPEADEALRRAAELLDGLLLVGTINSIGVRRDAKALELLAGKLEEKDEEVASAAAVALGRIGDEAAAKSLRGALTRSSAKMRSAAAEGMVLCAERLQTKGYSAKAVEIYDEVRKADVPKQRLIEATRGAILARGQEGMPILLEQLRSPDKGFFQLALSTFREFPGGEIDKAFAQELDQAPPQRAALLIYAMADRPETVLVPAITSAAAKGEKPVRLAAVESLGRVGDASCLATLLEVALDSDAELSESARASLAELKGEKIDAELAALLPNAKGKSYPLLIELVGERHIAAEAELLKALDHSDKTVRGAALKALGETVSLERLSVLVSQVVKPKSPDDAPAAQAALKAASIRMPDREACAEQLAMALNAAPGTTKTLLLEILGEVGGEKSLDTLAKAAKSDDPDMQDNASRVLGKWNGVDAAPVLLDLAKNAPEGKYQVRALRGYIGLARKFAMPEEERAAMCQKALETAKQPAEKLLVLEVLKLHPSTDGLKLAVKAVKTPELKDAATEATLVIAQKVKGKGGDVRQLLTQAGLETVKLEIIKAEYGAGSVQKDVTAILKKQAGELPLVTLPASSYNASFGGDPVPGTAKKLKVQYKINGKDAQATFDEDAVIIFAMPK